MAKKTDESNSTRDLAARDVADAMERAKQIMLAAGYLGLAEPVAILAAAILRREEWLEGPYEK